MSAGYRSLTGSWVGGLGVAPVIVNGGYRSYPLFWLGGLCALQGTPPEPVEDNGWLGGDWKKKKKKQDDGYTFVIPAQQYKEEIQDIDRRLASQEEVTKASVSPIAAPHALSDKDIRELLLRRAYLYRLLDDEEAILAILFSTFH